MKKSEAIKQVQECMSSVFSKEDVINLINKIEGTLSRGDALSIKEYIEMDLNKADVRTLVDYDTAEFELTSNNQIELMSVNVELDLIMSIVEEHLMELVEVPM